ncbi:AAA-like domain-containing protein [Nodularia spumigena CS-584]|jgi:transcriptional regulator with XRE-family HTH domain|uniref:AAA-like domain-containing protein n=2 Tax=Nodularia spumigena TaxID=70799 RepID=UPI0000EAA5CB|nr:AAA-like domain-containing protein [Nodularia spumigena]AHJ30085.1 WD40 repeat protein [Nodularia spumigena CCY9414]EAW43067.1 serine/threonine protein kinase [Nodularia spumigena CCY9414]MDB9384416.1 AAA-like domain-containing protein [Nodularia spumigena CS-584]
MQLQSKNQLRRRGATLTAQGFKKLNQAKAEVEIQQNFKRYTLEALSEKTGLTPNTLSKVFNSATGVDKRTLECCFNAFNLTLLKDDYLYLESDKDNLGKIGSMSTNENCCSIEPVCDSRTNPPQTHRVERFPKGRQSRTPDDLQLRPTTVPGGQMPLDSVFYIDRPILESLCYEAIQEPGALVNIRAPKQMGKTSLMTSILAYCNSLGNRTVSLNLQLANDEILQNLERFLQWFCVRASKQLDLPVAIALCSMATFWDNSLGSKSNATDYLEEILLAKLNRAGSPRENRSLVIAIDELNELFAYPDIAREFLLLLRTWSERAKESDADINPWHRLRLVTVHSTEILMPPSINPSLLNTGLVIELPEFTPAQVQELANRWGEEMTVQQIEQLITLLGGHPYRLQLAFYHLHQQTITLEELLENSAFTTTIYAEHLEQQWWNLQRYPDLLPLFTEIVRQSNLVYSEAVQASQLYKMGLMHLHGKMSSLACELFRPFFGDRLL